MRKAKTSDELRPEYQREDLGIGFCGKYFEEYSKGTNLVLLSPGVAKMKGKGKQLIAVSKPEEMQTVKQVAISILNRTA